MVLADGCFDPLHIGHVRYLRTAWNAREYGEGFVVRIAPDDAIIAKGRTVFQTRPERAACVKAIVPDGEVSYTDQLADAVRNLEPRVLVKGWDWYGRLPADVVAACEEVGTAVAFVQTQERTSTERLG